MLEEENNQKNERKVMAPFGRAFLYKVAHYEILDKRSRSCRVFKTRLFLPSKIQCFYFGMYLDTTLSTVEVALFALFSSLWCS